MPSTFSALFPPPPVFTEKDLSSLTGKVFIVTGAASGVGFELAKILYGAGGTVYVAARSASRCEGAISKIKSQLGGRKSAGKLERMIVDLADLGTIKGAVDEFLRRETRLDGLIHNAGVMTPPAGSKSKQVRRDLVGVVECRWLTEMYRDMTWRLRRIAWRPT